MANNRCDAFISHAGETKLKLRSR